MRVRAAMCCAILFPDRVQVVMSVDAPAWSLKLFLGFSDRNQEMTKSSQNLTPLGWLKNSF